MRGFSGVFYIKLFSVRRSEVMVQIIARFGRGTAYVGRSVLSKYRIVKKVQVIFKEKMFAKNRRPR